MTSGGNAGTWDDVGRFSTDRTDRSPESDDGPMYLGIKELRRRALSTLPSRTSSSHDCQGWTRG